MDVLLARQKQLEETNATLCMKAGDLRRSLHNLELTQTRYLELRDRPEDKLSISEYVAVSREWGVWLDRDQPEDKLSISEYVAVSREWRV